MKKRGNVFIYSLLAMLVLVGCKGKEGGHKEGEIRIIRVEQTMFDTDLDRLPDELRRIKREYDSPLLNIYPDDPQFMSQLGGFVSDSIVRDIYRITDNKYRNLYWLESELTDALKRAKELDEEIEYRSFATFVSGTFDYSQRVAAPRETKSVLVSIDQYALGEMEKYSYFGLPMFIVERCDSVYLASDIMAEIARQYTAMPDEEDVMMLDLMIAEGKVLYFLDQVMPKKEDCVKIRYTEEQMEWMRAHEGNVWAYFIQNNLLYEKDFSRYHNFVDEAPKTNAFKDSAPRTTHYIGWQIVRRYMENRGCTMKELFENTDSQAILAASKYKP